ncbi:MAG: SDR family NAD(P)-dependent oxidoreductase, partial [Bacteroidota bacterium]
MFRLDGQLAIITGGAQGIGAGICEVFLEAGARVALWDITDGQPIVDQLKSADKHIFYQKVN